jgi:ectoine hydroxylase-related dioxygenase (phytanoyl-CoA dioxygenase family)
MVAMTKLSRQGFQILEGVFTPEAVCSFRAAINETIDRAAHAMRAPFPASHPEAPIEERLDRAATHDRVYSLALFRAALADAQRDPRIEAIASHPRLTALTSDLLAPMKRTGQTIRARAAVPAFTRARSSWHQDVVRDADSGCGTVRFACWMPLHDVDASSGALEIIPGAWQPLPHTEDPEGGRFYIPESDLPRAERKTVPVRCGDVLVIDRFLPHRSLPMEGDRARWAIVMWIKGVKAFTSKKETATDYADYTDLSAGQSI